MNREKVLTCELPGPLKAGSSAAAEIEFDVSARLTGGMDSLAFPFLEVYSASQGSVDTNLENNRGEQREGGEGKTHVYPTNIGTTRTSATATPLVVISDGGGSKFGLVSGCSRGFTILTPALALG